MKIKSSTEVTYTIELSEQELQIIVHSIGTTCGSDLQQAFNDSFQEYKPEIAIKHQQIYEELYNVIY